MAVAEWDAADTERAKQFWANYSSTNDVSNLRGQTAGIDPKTGRVWFGKSASDIVAQMDRSGEFTPLYFVRVGHDWYFRKGVRR